MTAGEEINSSNSEEIIDKEKQSTIPEEIVGIFEFLSFNEKIVFKSQQIDDPELERSEKIEIAKQIYLRNRQTFLQRFGGYFEVHHLEAFESLASSAVWSEHENGDEINDILLEYRRRLLTRERDVKNRRYTAMQQLIKQGDYFSELEMMNRAPELYQELVGQYLNDDEKRQRDCYDVKNTTFSGILMHTLEQQQRDALLKEADEELEKEQEGDLEKPQTSKQKTTHAAYTTSVVGRSSFVVEEDESVDACEKTQQNSSIELEEYEVPQACRQQWGNFDNENIACSTTSVSKNPKKITSKTSQISSNEFITAGERDLLRQEFLGIMHERFLAGKDANFDYSLVDDNTQLDDLSQLNQDKEDAYFDTSDDDDDIADEETKIAVEHTSDTESEDELDVYMRHLNRHHSLMS